MRLLLTLGIIPGSVIATLTLSLKALNKLNKYGIPIKIKPRYPPMLKQAKISKHTVGVVIITKVNMRQCH
jgi:hypothetical protein